MKIIVPAERGRSEAQTARETLAKFTARYAQALGGERYTLPRTPLSSSSSAEAVHFGRSAPASTEGRVLKRGTTERYGTTNQ